jgi:hypothetical protein
MLLALLAGLGLGALAWRLEQGPLPVSWLAERAEAAFNAGGPTRVHVEAATLAWAGWREGHRSPLELTLRRVRAVDADGLVRAELPDAVVSLSLPWLLRGVVAPRAMELRGLSLNAARGADGALSLDLGSLAEGAPQPEAGAEAAAGEALLDMLAELMRPPSDATPLAALRLLRVSDARLKVVDAQLGRSWSAEIETLALTRRERGGIELAGNGAGTLGAERVPLRISGMLDGATGQGSVTLGLPSVRPAALARTSPALAPLAALDAPAALALDVRLQGLALPRMALARLRAGAGVLDLGRAGRLALSSLEADLTLDDEVLRVERAVLRPAPPGTPGAGPAPRIQARAEARPVDGRWQAEATLGIDRVTVSELAHYWPAGLAPNARHWVTENLTEGVARDGTWQVRAAWDSASGALSVTGLDGTLEAEDLTVHWLRPVPPAEDARGRVTFTLDTIGIAISGGTQSGTAVAVRDGRIRFDLSREPEAAEMEFGLAGPVADVWTLLRHPRLGLFRSRPPPINEITGTLREGRLSIAFPLLADIPVEVLRVSATGRGTDIRIPRLVLGKDLERGAFEFTADMNGLRTSGTATVLGIPLRIQQEADFRPGAANQVVAREVVTGRADAGQIAGFGLDPRPFVEGPVGLDIRTETRRNGQGRVTMRADFRDSRLAVDPLAWAKPPGTAGNGEATFLLQNGQLTAINDIRITAPDALVRARGTQLRQNVPQRVEIQQANLGRNRFAGELFPPGAGAPGWRVALRGPVLDLAPILARPSAPAARDGEPAGGPPIGLEGRFDRVLLAGDRALLAMTINATVAGTGVVQAAQLRARMAENGSFDLAITPEGGRRRLRLTSDDGGALLRAFGVLRTIQGGRLQVDAAYPHGRPDAPLSGTAELEEFAVRDAPAFGKLLQAMSVFGVFEALSGQGLSFVSLTAPFTLTREALVLNDARAFSVSLGLTAKGRIDRLRDTIDFEGTIVPAYVFNSLLGRIPGLGRIFSPETGGGLFAATYRMRGPLADPSVSVNPLAALTPGFLRGIFGIGQGAGPAQGGR